MVGLLCWGSNTRNQDTVATNMQPLTIVSFLGTKTAVPRISVATPRLFWSHVVFGSVTAVLPGIYSGSSPRADLLIVIVIR